MYCFEIFKKKKLHARGKLNRLVLAIIYPKINIIARLARISISSPWNMGHALAMQRLLDNVNNIQSKA
jgi:hypothetical protein